jgi:endonuclease/exonuclease/phosphatase family metal-dependent hydrolase
MRVVTYNIQYSRGKDGRFDLDRCIAEVADADIIALQEVERFWQRSGMTDQPAAIAARLPEFYWVYGPSFDVQLSNGNASTEAAGANGAVDSRRRQFGDMLLSRWPIVSSRLIPLPKTHYADRFNMAMGGLEGVIDSPLGPLRVWSIHIGHLEAPERLEQLRTLLQVQARGSLEYGAWSGPGNIGADDWVEGMDPPPMPEATIWLGDFNMTPDSEEYSLLTSNAGTGGGFLDAWETAPQREGQGPTYPERVIDGRIEGDRLDYAFLSADLAPRLAACRIDDEAQGSDHQPVWIELELERTG